CTFVATEYTSWSNLSIILHNLVGFKLPVSRVLRMLAWRSAQFAWIILLKLRRFQCALSGLNRNGSYGRPAFCSFLLLGFTSRLSPASRNNAGMIRTGPMDLLCRFFPSLCCGVNALA